MWVKYKKKIENLILWHGGSLKFAFCILTWGQFWNSFSYPCLNEIKSNGGHNVRGVNFLANSKVKRKKIQFFDMEVHFVLYEVNFEILFLYPYQNEIKSKGGYNDRRVNFLANLIVCKCNVRDSKTQFVRVHLEWKKYEVRERLQGLLQTWAVHLTFNKKVPYNCYHFDTRPKKTFRL